MLLVLIYVKAYVLFMKHIARFHAALADETRLRLLRLMEPGEICVCHLQSILDTNQPKISRHLAYLKRAGLVEGRKEGKWTHYRLRKLEPEMDKILARTLACLGREPQVRKDLLSLESLSC